MLRWDTLLEIQVNIFLPYELQYLIACPAWTGARSVTDAGCGNGYFLSSLQRYFPEKLYRGLDISEELIAVAKATYENPDLTFECGDFFSFEPEATVDFLFMRLIVQHLRGMDDILERASRILRPGGSLLIVEPDPPSFMTFPTTPRFMELLQAVEVHGAKHKKNRADIAAIGAAVDKSDGWQLADDKTIVVSQTGPFANSMWQEMYLLWVDSLDSAGEFEFPFQLVREEIEDWAQTETTYSQIGIRFFALEHTPINKA